MAMPQDVNLNRLVRCVERSVKPTPQVVLVAQQRMEMVLSVLPTRAVPIAQALWFVSKPLHLPAQRVLPLNPLVMV